MFGMVEESPQNENTRFLSPQPLRRGQALWPLDYRQLARKVMACSRARGFSSITNRRVEESNSVTRKVSYNVARIKLGLQKKSRWGIWTLSGIGDLPATMSAPCG